MSNSNSCIIKYRNSSRRRIAKNEMKKIIDTIIENHKIYERNKLKLAGLSFKSVNYDKQK